MLAYEPLARPSLDDLQLIIKKLKEKCSTPSNNKSKEENEDLNFFKVAGIEEDEDFTQYSKQNQKGAK